MTTKDFFDKYIKDKEFTLKKQSVIMSLKYRETCCTLEHKAGSLYIRFRIMYNGNVLAATFLDFQKMSTRTFKLYETNDFSKFFKSYAYRYMGL